MKPVPKLGSLSPLPIKCILRGKRKSPRCWCVGSEADWLRSDQQFPPARASSGHCGRQGGIFTCQCIRERHQIAGCLSLRFGSVSRSVVSDSLRPHESPGLPVHHQLPEFTQIHDLVLIFKATRSNRSELWRQEFYSFQHLKCVCKFCTHFSLYATEVIISTSYIRLFSRGSNKA